MPRYAYLLLPLIGGAMIAAQAPVNARLRLVLGSPVGSALVSFVVGTVLLFGAVVVAGDAGRLGALGGGPWWAYLGGAFGAVFVFATLVASPRLGVTTTFVAVIVGQVALAALIDRFGWLGADAVPFSWGAPGGPRADVRQPGAAAAIRLGGEGAETSPPPGSGHVEQTTFTHCGCVALPLARLPPPSIEPGVASIPWPWFLPGGVALQRVPARGAGLCPRRSRSRCRRSRCATLPDQAVAVRSRTGRPRARSRRRCPRAVLARSGCSWRSKKKSPVSFPVAVLPTTRSVAGGADHDADGRVAVRAVATDRRWSRSRR